MAASKIFVNKFIKISWDCYLVKIIFELTSVNDKIIIYDETEIIN